MFCNEANRGFDSKRKRITDGLLKKHGYTEGCDGCRFKKTDLGDHRGHSDKCRKMLEEEMGKDEDGKRKRSRDKMRIEYKMATVGWAL